VGVYLPYSPIQYLLFRHLKNDALIMTSANVKGEPLIIDNVTAFELKLDAYLLHNRKIFNRVDDSLIIPYGKKYFFIRKSRGFVPVPIDVNYKKIILTVGAERNVTAAISKKGKLYTSQYIGNTYYYNTLEYLDEAIRHLIRLLGIEKLDAVAFDLHPQYPTRRFALEFAEEFGVDPLEIQHHWSHAASLMLDKEIYEPIIALTFDGAGYGPDGTIWGGEVLYSYKDRYKQIGSLELLPLIGGDMAVHHPRRLIFGILEKLGMDGNMLDYFTIGEADVYRNIIKTSPQTSSLGRILDSLSCYFGIANERTYDGEPAMKLERYLAAGVPEYEFSTKLTSLEDGPKIIRTLPLFKQLFDYSVSADPTELSFEEKANLCHSFVKELMKNFVKIAIEGAKEFNCNFIGLSGGVTYNLPIVKMVENEIKFAKEIGICPENIELLTHSRIPNGDGGISAGQNIIASHMLGDEATV